MRQIWVTGVSLALSFAAVAQVALKPKLSDESLTPEQIAIYRAALEDYTKGSDGVLNLADRTETLGQSGSMFDEACVKGIKIEVAKTSALVIHRLDPSVALSKRIVLVNPDRQQETIKENDPQNLGKKAVDDHEVTDKRVGESVKRAFETGLFTLSEIAFDKEHHHAVVAYSFVCGTLCGNGNTLVLKKVGQAWRVTKRCGGWVS
jgi:hypothetical protein